MARIRIKKKKKGSGWAWIISVLIITGATLLMVEFMTEDEAERRNLSDKINKWSQDGRQYGNTIPEARQTRDVIDDYIIFVNRGFRSGEADEVRVKEGMERLTEAIGEVIKNTDPQARELVHHHNKLKRQVKAGVAVVSADSAVAGEQDRQFKESFSTAANVFVIIQRQEYPELKAVGDAVVESAGKIHPKTELEDQGQSVCDFFFATAEALETMKRKFYKELSLVDKEGGNYDYR